MLTYIKIVVAGLFVASLIILGWKIAGWRHDASLLEGARLELRNELQRRVRADADRLSLEVKLSKAEAKIGTGVKIVTKSIREYIHDTAPCRVYAPVSNSLRDLRAGIVPAAAPEPAVARAAP